jgi:chromate reductase
MIRVIAIAGSLRAESRSRFVAQAAIGLAPEGVEVEVFELADVPLYNSDLEADGGPPAVRSLKAAVSQADGLLLVAPDYNHGMSGVLKNAIDWLSRPAYGSPLAGKPVALIGLAHSDTGGALALSQLKPVLLGTLAEPFPIRDVLIPHAAQKVGPEGITDAKTEERVQRLLHAFAGKLTARAASSAASSASSHSTS